MSRGCRHRTAHPRKRENKEVQPINPPRAEIFCPGPNVIDLKAAVRVLAEKTLQIDSWPQTIPEFDRLIEATQDELIQFAAYRLGNKADAEDVVQDVYVQAFRDREKRRGITDVRPYLFRMTGNRCTDLLRARKHRNRMSAGDVASSEDLFGSLAEAQRIARLRALLERIPGREAEVIRMRAWSELPFSEIAKAVNAPLPTVKTRFRLGVERLRSLASSSGGQKK